MRRKTLAYTLIPILGVILTATVYLNIGCSCSSDLMAQEVAPSCSLSKGELDERRVLARSVIGESLVGWRREADGAFTLRIESGGVVEATRLVMLERRCCVGVGATLTLAPDSEHADLRLTGPEIFDKELAAMLKGAPKL